MIVIAVSGFDFLFESFECRNHQRKTFGVRMESQLRFAFSDKRQNVFRSIHYFAHSLK